MAQTLNMDAMISRADFTADKTTSGSNRITQIKVSDLKEDNLLRTLLKKPDFQRETRDWGVDQVISFLTSIIERHFIPAVILWQNDANDIFVIDGAHRLSALMAWINDDYGDGVISQQFYGNRIPEEIIEYAQTARKKIEKSVGRYSLYYDAAKNPQKYDETFCKKARGLELFSFVIQWIDGDVSVAEQSFLNINQKAVPISPVEMMILQSRNKPLGIATRAIAYSGNGYKYWKHFDEDKQDEIEKISEEINRILFLPKTSTPISTLDVSLAGKNKMDLSLIYDLIGYCNDNIPDVVDNTGDETIKILKTTRRVLQTINSKEPGSLGLHPIVYFYSRKGNFKPALFFAFVLFVKDLELRRKKKDFTSIRKQFEEFIYKYDYIFDQINRQLRSTKKSAVPLKDVFVLIFHNMLDNKREKTIVKNILSLYPKINTIENPDYEESEGRDFNSNRKSETYISKALPGCVRCGICGGIVHVNSTSIDHVTRKSDGGLGVVQNGQVTHPFCNTGYKN